MKQLSYILTSVIFLISCSKNENEDKNIKSNAPLITKLKVYEYYQIPEENNISDPYLYFEYDNQSRLTKRVGGFISLPASSGSSDIFTNEIYTSLSYDNNKVTLEDFSALTDYIAPKNYKYYTLKNNSQIEIKEVPNVSNSYWNKKLTYNYSNNKLTQIITSFPNLPYDPNDSNDYHLTYLENFFYDSNDNLIRTEYYEQHNGISTDEKIVKEFKNYDNALNSFKKLYLLEDYFYRSLSTNNFRNYSKTSYIGSTITSHSETNWGFNYDSNGNIIFT